MGNLHKLENKIDRIIEMVIDNDYKTVVELVKLKHKTHKLRMVLKDKSQEARDEEISSTMSRVGKCSPDNSPLVQSLTPLTPEGYIDFTRRNNNG